MRIISFIEDQEIIKAILDHLGLWLIRSRLPAHAPPFHRYAGDELAKSIPDKVTYGDPDYPWDTYVT